MPPQVIKEFSEIQLNLIQVRVNKLDQLQPASPRYFRDSWSLVSSINRQIQDENVKKNLAVLKEHPGRYYYGDDRLPFNLFRLEKMFTIYSVKGWDLTIDDLELNLFDIEEVLDNARQELDMLVDFIIAYYDLKIQRMQFSLMRPKMASSPSPESLIDDSSSPSDAKRELNGT